MNYRVTQQKVYDKTGKLIEGYSGNFRADTGECLAITSDKYKIVHHQDALDAVQSCLDFGDYKRKLYSIKDGRRLYAVYDFSDQRQQIQKGDDSRSSPNRLYKWDGCDGQGQSCHSATQE